MLLRPLSFCCGALFSLCIVYFGRVYISDLEYDSLSKGWSSSGKNASSEASTVVTNESSIEVPTVKYSVEDLVTNSTLGFGKILAINLPSRSDRRDLLTLGALHTDVQLEWIEGVNGADISQKAWPLHWNTRPNAQGMNVTLGELGCWRSHMNALQRIINEGWSTALIIEDDSDWDVNIKSQMALFANSTRKLSNTRHEVSQWITGDSPTTNPYGNDWDLLWLGACANPPGPADSQMFAGESGAPAHWVYYAQGGMACTWGYAVTQAGARSLMAFMTDVDSAVDFAMSQYCGQHDCIIVWPELIGSHKPAGGLVGGVDKDTDIGHGGQGEYRKEGSTGNVVNSAIMAALEKWGPKGPWQS